MFLQLTLLSLFLQDFIYHNAVSALWMPDCSKTKHQDKPQCVCKNPKNWHMQVCQDFWKKPVIQKNVESRIVGGENAPANAYPWFARLVTRNGSWWGCGGTLIAKEYVLTAAHCVRSSDAGSLAVEIGAVCPYNSNNNNCGVPVQTLNAVSVVQHPQYNSNTVENDFAIIRLAGTANADPVPIDEGSFVDNYPSDKRGLWAIGFGSLSAGGSVSSQLRHVELAFVPRNTCNSAYSGGITNVMMCAADPGQDSCQGDSGGPLYDLQNNALVGVVSWGFGCADPRYPGVYAQVSSRINWIVSETCSSGPLPAYCPNAPTPTAPTPTAPTPTAPTPTAPTPTAPTPTAPTPTAPTPTAPTPTTSIPPIALKPCRRDDKNRFAMELTTDDYGSDTSVAVWKRKNNGSFGRLVYYADNFASAATYTLDKCLKVSGCYRVEIYDSYGDGLCCTYGQGSYQAYWDGSAIGSPPFEDGFVIDSDTFGNC